MYSAAVAALRIVEQRFGLRQVHAAMSAPDHDQRITLCRLGG
jgi:hypothetical protein